MPQYTRNDNGKASQMMWDAGIGGGGAYVNCSCGKDHCAEDDDTGEIEEYIEYINLDGQVFVWGCEGCDARLARYEEFIWSDRSTIRQYLKIRVDQEKAWADQEKLMNTISGIDQNAYAE